MSAPPAIRLLIQFRNDIVPLSQKYVAKYVYILFYCNNNLSLSFRTHHGNTVDTVVMATTM